MVALRYTVLSLHSFTLGPRRALYCTEFIRGIVAFGELPPDRAICHHPPLRTSSPRQRGFFCCFAPLVNWLLHYIMGLYARYMDQWERKLATRDTNRVVRPFEWGTDWLHSLGFPACPAGRQRQLEGVRGPFATEAVADSDRFFAYQPVSDYRLEGSHLTFTSPVHTPYPENNTVHAEWFPAPNDRGRAVIVLPQWNSGGGRPRGPGQAAEPLRNQRAAHDEGVPRRAQAGGTERADYHVSSNVGPDHPCRPPVGYRRARLRGLAGAVGLRPDRHPGNQPGLVRRIPGRRPRLPDRMGIFNHVSMHFADVVWTGLSTQNVSQAFAGKVSQEELRNYWSVISPASYLQRFRDRDMQDPADLGQPRQHFSAGVLQTGAGQLPRTQTAAQRLHPAVRPLHHRAVPVQPHGRAGDVPVRGPQPVT